MGFLFRISLELHLTVSNQGGPRASSCMVKGGDRFYRGDKEAERHSKRVCGFSFAESLLGKEEGSFFFRLCSAVITAGESSPFWSPNSF